MPIRLKLAAVSASLTFVILLLCAIGVGVFTEQKLRSTFDSDLKATAADLQSQFQIRGFEVKSDPATGELKVTVDVELFRLAAAGGAAVRLFDRANDRVYSLPAAPDLGPLYEGVRDVGDYRVVSRPLFVELDQHDRRLPRDPATARRQRRGDPVRQADRQSRGDHRAGLAVPAARRADRHGARLHRGLLRGATGDAADLRADEGRARGRAHARSGAHALPRPAANDEVAELATTLSEMLAELDAARSETETTLDRQRQFVADASHELRTPLTSILANLELLEEELERPGGPRDSAAAADIAGSALRSSRRMRRLVGDLLLLARADAGRREPPLPVDLAAVAREAAREAAAVGGDHPLTLDVPDRPDAVTIDGSRDDLHRLVLNLIENAFLHTPAGTPVVASVRREGGDVVVEVADRGPGVPAGQRERVFERFARSEGDRSAARGSGLGLAIVRAVADAHDGTAAVRDAEGGGARFEIRLPAGPSRSPSARVDEVDAAPSTDAEEAART